MNRQRAAMLGAGALVALALVAGTFIAWPTASLPSFAETRAAYAPSDAWLLDRHGAVVAQRRLDFGGRRLAWTALADVAPSLIDAVKRAEDRRFDRHRGVDLLAIAGSVRDRLRHGLRRGASTLTMQLVARLDAQLASQRGRRGTLAKLRQMRLAWQLERHWSKAQIVEAYLNLVGFRGETQGIAAAAATLFDKRPAQLSAAESATLAALLRDPAAQPAVVARRACAILGAADCATVATLAEDALRRGRRPALDADLAPHLARALLRRGGERVRSTLDARMQRLTEEALRNQLAALDARDVRDAAAIVLDNASGDVLAYVGSAGPYSTAAAVDGAAALRQAGSTLKPFLYGLAIERRLLTAASLLDDSPLDLETGAGLYIPQNYDHAFRGPVSVRAALAGSLNVPAVRTLELVGLELFRERLHALGYRHGLTESGEYYGFALALGSPEVTLLEQANAYRTLANGGLWSPLRLRADDAQSAPRRVIDAGAAYIVADILADNGARAASFGLGSPLATPFRSAAKTGTSKNMRDNWCIGFTARHTVAVWVGNFEGDPMRNSSGITGAAPAWLDIVTHLPAPPTAAPAPADGIVRVGIRYAGGEEPPRAEWFLSGSEQAEIRRIDAASARPRIASPADGLIAALDPDIPAAHQHLIFDARHARDARWRLDGSLIGPARTRQLWTPLPGRHHLELVSADGATLDAVRFEVRAVAAAGGER